MAAKEKLLRKGGGRMSNEAGANQQSRLPPLQGESPSRAAETDQSRTSLSAE